MPSYSRKSSLNKSNTSAAGKSTISDEQYQEYYRSVYLSLFKDIEEEISSSEELITLLQHAGYNPSKKTIEKYWNKDTDSYNFKQFCEIAKQEEKTSKNDLMKAFQKIDRNGDGFITHDELLQVLTKKGDRMTKSEVLAMIEDADFNGDGKLDYEEFCDMMESTSNTCQRLHMTPQKESARDITPKAMPRPDKKSTREHAKPSNSSFIRKEKDEKEKSHALSTRQSEDKSHKKSLLKSQSKDLNDKDEMKKGGNLSVQLKEEPKDLTRWNFQSTKGCFYKEEDGKMESHHFKIKVTQPTAVWMSIKALSPKYGKFSDEILESDMTIFLIEESPNSKLISFSNSLIDGKSCLSADLDIGVYSIVTFSSGTRLLQEQSDSGQVSLVKGTGDEMRLSKSCKDTFMEIFYRCDLDGNGFVNRNEFNEFQLRTSGENCDDEAWDVVKENFEVTPQSELTPNGFLNLNLMEARDPQGGPDELWITLDNMGYSNKLQLTMACPFLLEVYTKRVKVDISVVGVSDGGELLQLVLAEALKSISSVKAIKNKRDLILHTAQFDQRVTLAVENQSHGTVRVGLDCNGSTNMTSHQNTLVVSEDIEPKTMQIMHHLVPKDKSKRVQLNYTETIER